MQKTITLPEAYLGYSKRPVNGLKLHEFQSKIMDILDMKEDCLIVEAPTGSGKTFGFLLPLVGDFSKRIDSPKLLIITPTNSLAHEICDDVPKNAEKLGIKGNIKAKIWTAHTLGSWNTRINEINRSLNSNVIISNPDIISLMVSGFYLHPDNWREKQWPMIFRQVSVIIIDEFHSYPEEEIAKILSFIILAKRTGSTHIKYIFTSATPNKKLPKMLENYGISFTSCSETSVTEQPQNEGRMIRGKLSVTFTDQPIVDSVNEIVLNNDKKRVLFMTDHVVDAERIIDKIKRTKPNEPIWEITGAETRNVNRKDPTGNEKFIVATNAAELGLNMKIDVAHIEPGRYLENFKQRFGRIARGESGDLFVHVSTEIIKYLPDYVSSESDLFIKMEQLMSKKDFYITTVRRVVPAYIYLVYYSAKGQLKEQIFKIMKDDRYFNIFREFDSLISKFKENGEKNEGEVFTKKEIDCLVGWWESYLRAYGFFRGQSVNVRVRLPRIDEKETTFDIVWLEKYTEYERERNGSGEIFIVKEYLDHPKKVLLHFNFCGEFKVEEKQFRDPSEFRDIWENKLLSYFDEHRRGIAKDREISDIVKRLKELIRTRKEDGTDNFSVLSPMYPTLLPPVEVGRVENDIFL
jgi:CRISPR-associated helicase Cas3